MSGRAVLKAEGLQGGVLLWERVACLDGKLMFRAEGFCFEGRAYMRLTRLILRVRAARDMASPGLKGVYAQAGSGRFAPVSSVAPDRMRSLHKEGSPEVSILFILFCFIFFFCLLPVT